MRILLAGATGHTGERLARRLLMSGHEVRILTRKGRNDPLVAPLADFGAIPFPGDFNRRWLVWDALKGCDILVSCAHIRYAGACIQACERMGVRRYLQMSSTRRYTKWPCPTSREVIAGEEIITDSRLDYTIIRPTMIFGGCRDANVTRLVGWFRRRRWFPLFGNGKNLLQPVFVEDLVDAMMTAINNPDVSTRGEYTIAGPEPITYEQFLRETARACGVKRPLLLKVPYSIALMASRLIAPISGGRFLTPEQVRRLGEDKDADISRAIEELGFGPRSYSEAIHLKATGMAEVDKVYHPS